MVLTTTLIIGNFLPSVLITISPSELCSDVLFCFGLSLCDLGYLMCAPVLCSSLHYIDLIYTYVPFSHCHINMHGRALFFESVFPSFYLTCVFIFDLLLIWFQIQIIKILRLTRINNMLTIHTCILHIPELLSKHTLILLMLLNLDKLVLYLCCTLTPLFSLKFLYIQQKLILSPLGISHLLNLKNTLTFCND